MVASTSSLTLPLRLRLVGTRVSFGLRYWRRRLLSTIIAASESWSFDRFFSFRHIRFSHTLVVQPKTTCSVYDCLQRCLRIHIAWRFLSRKMLSPVKQCVLCFWSMSFHTVPYVIANISFCSFSLVKLPSIIIWTTIPACELLHFLWVAPGGLDLLTCFCRPPGVATRTKLGRGIWVTVGDGLLLHFSSCRFS